MTIKDLVKNADTAMREETKKYNQDIELLYDIALEGGKKLAKIYHANIDIVKIGISLMDLKLLEAQSLGIPKEHVKLSTEATKEMLKDYNLTEEEKENILHCVTEHHGVEKYFSIESEICANADCYKFLDPKGVFAYCSLLGRRFHDLTKEWKQLEYKMDENYSTLSLKEVKDELNPYYEQFKSLLEIAKRK